MEKPYENGRLGNSLRTAPYRDMEELMSSSPHVPWPWEIPHIMWRRRDPTWSAANGDFWRVGCIPWVFFRLKIFEFLWFIHGIFVPIGFLSDPKNDQKHLRGSSGWSKALLLLVHELFFSSFIGHVHTVLKILVDWESGVLCLNSESIYQDDVQHQWSTAHEHLSAWNLWCFFVISQWVTLWLWLT